jgi:hypothetical protein
MCLGVKKTTRTRIILTFAAAILATAATAWGDLPWTFIPTPQLPRHPPRFPREGEVEGFEPYRHTVWFKNYDIWEGSSLPASAQVFHCTGLSLLAREAFLSITFVPEGERSTPDQVEAVLRRVYHRDTRYPLLPRPAIYGYADLNELSDDSDIEPRIKKVLGDAIRDATRPDWTWTPFSDTDWSPSDGNGVELEIRKRLSRGWPVIIYLTDGLETAHAVLAFGYKTSDSDATIYRIYDPNAPMEERELPFNAATGRMIHSGYGARKPHILY